MPERLLNTVDYTPFELTLFVAGCFAWVVIYCIYVRNVVRYRFFEMPVIAAVSNFAWESQWTLIFKTDMGLLCEWLYGAWFVVDLFLIAAAFRYAPKQFENPDFKALSRPLFVVSVLFFFPFYYFFTAQGLDQPIGARSAYMCQMVLSCLYVVLILNRKSTEGFSPAVAWLRTYGTGLNTWMMLIHYPHDHWLHVLSVGSFVVDHGYLWAFYRLRRREQALDYVDQGQLMAPAL